MSLPDLIEIIPLAHPVGAEITVPGSKSITNRALVLAALNQGSTTLKGALWSEDTQVMVEGLLKLGFAVAVAEDRDEFCNRTITVQGGGGTIPKSGSREQPLELFVGNAGTAARFLTALVCLGHGFYKLHGVARMHERPQAALLDALRALGYQISANGDKLPLFIHGTGARPGKCRLSINESSQFASALLLCAHHGQWQVEISGENSEESPYVAMTSKLIAAFPKNGGTFHIEPDASSGSYFWAANWLINQGTHSKISVREWPVSGWQIDGEFPKFLPPPAKISRETDLGDSIMTAIAIAPAFSHQVVFTDLARLRVQECERVVALRTELQKCGAMVIESGQSLTIAPSPLHGAVIETYNDHRMAMCFATLGLRVPSIKIKNPACVKKTFPNFFQKLAAPPPHGLGARIIDGNTGAALKTEQLFAG